MHGVMSFTNSHVQLMLLYLDPGSGSMIIQLVIGALLAIGLTIRIFWSRIKVLFTHKKADVEITSTGETRPPKSDE